MPHISYISSPFPYARHVSKNPNAWSIGACEVGILEKEDCLEVYNNTSEELSLRLGEWQMVGMVNSWTYFPLLLNHLLRAAEYKKVFLELESPSDDLLFAFVDSLVAERIARHPCFAVTPNEQSYSSLPFYTHFILYRREEAKEWNDSVSKDREELLEEFRPHFERFLKDWKLVGK